MTADPSGEALSHYRHDLRTPVNAILGYVELIAEEDEGALPADVRAGLDDLRELGRQLLAGIGGVAAPAGASADDLRKVYAAVRASLEPIAGRVASRAAGLAAKVAAGLSAAQDLDRVRAAGEALEAVLRNADRPPAAASTPPTQPVPPAAAGPPQPAGLVLIVDDDPANRHLFARGVLKQGHAFVAAHDGESALAALRSHPFDVVLLDLLMPGMSGFEVLARIKRDPDRGHTPVIVVSALDQLDGVVQCLEAGAEDYLPKPCNPALLKARLGACLEKKRLRDRELEYLRQVEAVTAAAAAVEAGAYDPDRLAAVADRTDVLGTLARVFDRMAREVKAREEQLRNQVLQLRVEIDQAKRDRQVAEITESDFAKALLDQAAELRDWLSKESADPAPPPPPPAGS